MHQVLVHSVDVLQLLLWLYNPIREWLALLQMCGTVSSVTAVSAVLSFSTDHV